MPQTFFCIYTGQEFPETQRSLEHIVPYAIGGSDAFVTKDVSRSANSKLGTSVDAPLVDDLRVTLARMRLKLVSQSGKHASLVFNATTSIDGHPRRARYTIPTDGEPKIDILPDVVWNTEKVEFRCTPDEAAHILEKIQHRATKKGLSLSAPSINKRASWEELNIQFEGSIGLHAYHRCFVKMALGAAHFSFGHTWSRSVHADRLRQCLTEPDPRKWPIKHSVPLEGAPEDFKSLFGIGDDKHVLVIWNQGSRPLLFSCILFGEIYGSIPLADNLRAQDLELGDSIIYVVDCRNRSLSRYTAIEFLERISSD